MKIKENCDLSIQKKRVAPTSEILEHLASIYKKACQGGVGLPDEYVT